MQICLTPFRLPILYKNINYLGPIHLLGIFMFCHYLLVWCGIVSFCVSVCRLLSKSLCLNAYLHWHTLWRSSGLRDRVWFAIRVHKTYSKSKGEKNGGLRHLMKRHSQHSVHGDICCCCWMEADTHIAHLESHRRIEESTGMQRWSHEMERRQNITVFFQRPWCCPSFLGSPHTEGDRLSGWRYSRSASLGGWDFHNDGRRFCKVPLEDALHGWLSAGFRLGNYIC